MTAATIGNWSFEFGDSPLTPLEEVLSVSEVGETNELLDVTNFDSTVGKKEFIPGLSEGDEVSIECNHVPSGAGQAALRALVASGGSSDAVLTYTGSPNELYSFAFAAISWKLAPSISEQNKISYTVKISDGVTVS